MTHGGFRKGAGRPVGTGKYQAPTKIMRIPIAMQDDIDGFIKTKGQALACYSSPVQAGYPTGLGQADEPEYINLFNSIIHNPSNSFVLFAQGDSMIGAGIHSGDMLVVERGTEVSDGDIVIASVDNDFTVKRLSYVDQKPCLLPENPAYQPVPITAGSDVIIWGVVTHCIHKVS